MLPSMLSKEILFGTYVGGDLPTRDRVAFTKVRVMENFILAFFSEKK